MLTGWQGGPAPYKSTRGTFEGSRFKASWAGRGLNKSLISINDAVVRFNRGEEGVLALHSKALAESIELDPGYIWTPQQRPYGNDIPINTVAEHALSDQIPRRHVSKQNLFKALCRQPLDRGYFSPAFEDHGWFH